MEALRRVRHDVYHLPEYVRFAARWQEQGRPLAFVAEDHHRRFFLPVIVRPIPPKITGNGRPLFDATGPRGYPGPLVSSGAGIEDRGFLDAAVQAFAEIASAESIVSAFIRLHPLLSPSRDLLGHAGSVVEHGDSVSIDLSLSEAELWRDTRRDHRSSINSARKLGYVARIDETWERFDEFVALYERTMERLQAAPFWRLSRGYFEDLRQSLGDKLFLCVAEVGGEVAAASLLTEVDGIVEYHLTGTADAHRFASPTKLIINFATRWAKARRNRCFHLTGSLRKGDSLHEFKIGFSPIEHSVCSWRIVADTSAYEMLLERWEAEHHCKADSPEEYFPAYRKLGSIPE